MGDAGVSRRRLLALGGMAAVTALATSCGGGLIDLGGAGAGFPEGASCVPRASLDSQRSVAGLPLLYEPTRRRAAFSFDPGFFRRLEGWAGALDDTLPSPARELWTYGSWVDGRGRCDSWHHAGRAFDLARVRLADGSEVSCRYDRWRTLEPVALNRTRRAYWALAAGLHLRFSYVLTYLYDAQHANHIHVDNGRSGDSDATFSPRSRVQVQAVQAIATYLWESPLELSGEWDRASEETTGRLLGSLGVSDGLRTRTGWATLLTASAARGAG